MFLARPVLNIPAPEMVLPRSRSMPVQIFSNEFTPLSANKLAQWATIPPAIAGDVTNRQNVIGRAPLLTILAST